MELTDAMVILALLVLLAHKASKALRESAALLDRLDRKVNEAQREKSRRNG